MNTIFISVIAAFLVLFLVLYVDEKFFKPKRKTRPPVEKILNLISTGSGFVVHNSEYNAPKEISDSMYVDWTLEDTVTGELTWMYRFIFSDGHDAIVQGDLSWMNSYEKNRVYELVNEIGKRQNKQLLLQIEKEQQRINDARREEAKKIYENR